MRDIFRRRRDGFGHVVLGWGKSEEINLRSSHIGERVKVEHIAQPARQQSRCFDVCGRRGVPDVF
jgi:hypothetical protein